MQLNVLFCCLWRNVETSCQKHFVVLSRHQQTPPVIPAKCHNLRDVVRRRRIYNTWPVTALTAVKPDIGWGSRFLPTPPAFDAPVRGVSVGILLCRWHGKTRMAWLPDGEKILMICLFVLTQLTNVTDRQIDTAWRQRPRLMLASRGKNVF